MFEKLIGITCFKSCCNGSLINEYTWDEYIDTTKHRDEIVVVYGYLEDGLTDEERRELISCTVY